MCFGRLKVIAIAAALVLSAGSAMAFTVDGRVSGDDNYTVSYDLTFYVWNTNSGGDQIVEGGSLRLGRDGANGDIFMLLELPTSIVDNVYGDPSEDPNSGWAGKHYHTYTHIVQSDAFEFEVATTSGDQFIKIDYLNGDTQSARIESDVSGTVVSAASSIQYNLSKGYGDTINSLDPYSGSPPADWLKAVQYEIRLDGSRFASGELLNLADISSPWLHLSPNKLKGDKLVKVKCLYYSNCELSDDQQEPPPVAMPAPGGALIFAIAVGVLGYARRRRTAV